LSTPIEPDARSKNPWRTSFEVEVEKSSCELRIVRTGLSTYSVFLDGVPLDARLTIPSIYFSPQDIRLPDGSTVTVRGWGPFGWSVKRNGSKLSTISKSPVAVAILTLCILAPPLTYLLVFDPWKSIPEYEQASPPVWASLATSENNHRWFINTQSVRKRAATAQVEVLIRETNASMEDESTTVELLTCDPKAELYRVMVNMKTFKGPSFPHELPPDSELYGGAMENFSRSAITDGTVSTPIWNAGCFLGFHRKNVETPESTSDRAMLSQALNVATIGKSPNDLIMMRDFDGVLLQVGFGTFMQGMFTEEKQSPGTGALKYVREHRKKLHDLTVDANVQEKKLSKDNGAKTLLSPPIDLTSDQIKRLGECAAEWHALLEMHKHYAEMLNHYAATGNRQYLELYISTVGKVQKVGPTSNLAVCKSW
jgi:hypothetical protein